MVSSLKTIDYREAKQTELPAAKTERRMMETIDKLYLELSQVSKAVTEKELTLQSALAEKERELAELREKYEVFAPVCRKCGDPLTTDELICENCR